MITWNLKKRKKLLSVLARDNNCCHYCGRILNLETKSKNPEKKITLDHIVPRSKGGTWANENLVISCGKCNSLKSDMSYDVFRQVPVEYLVLSKKKRKLMKNSLFIVIDCKPQLRQDWKELWKEFNEKYVLD